ncbi:MAG: nitroreductase/quinone reductase family protein, partial [Nitrososphaeraceae archaeon]
YKNMLVDRILKISINGIEISERGKQLTDTSIVKDIVEKFKSKYGEGEVKKYYKIFDAAVEVTL